jgi:hypothetical protein
MREMAAEGQNPSEEKTVHNFIKFSFIVGGLALLFVLPANAGVSTVKVPEPAMFGMLAAGVGAIALLRGLRKR